MESAFESAARAMTGATRAGELSTLWVSGERSDFVRFNRGRVRQAGTVQQSLARVHLVIGRRHAELSLTLAGDDTDAAAVREAVDALREVVATAPEDPHLVTPDVVASSHARRAGALPASSEAIDALLELGGDLDLVGFYASGPLWRGFASSTGQRNWHEVESFSLEWSLYHRADKAIRAAWAGSRWSAEELSTRMAHAKAQYAALSRPARRIGPGSYRAWLTPTAVRELTQMLCWGGFSGRARATRQGCLLRMQTGDARMSPRVTLTENLADGVAPRFTSEGFVRPERVALVRAGELGDALVSPRTAREFGVAHNGAAPSETPESLEMEPGELPSDEALARLGEGLWVGNLWYLNFSDRPACRVTGMTRFGTFWVEGGEVVAPLDVMRFDDSLLRVFGDHLEGLSREREFIPNSDTWRERSVESVRLPGALVSSLCLTL